MHGTRKAIVKTSRYFPLGGGGDRQGPRINSSASLKERFSLVRMSSWSLSTSYFILNPIGVRSFHFCSRMFKAISSQIVFA